MASREFSRRTDRIEELIARVEGSGDPATRAVAKELLQAVIELHGVALEQILEAMTDLPGGQEALDCVSSDEIVSAVLSLHGIHPEPLEARVGAALDQVRPYLKSHGGSVELVEITSGTIRLRLSGACGHCSGSAQTMKNTVEQAIYGVAPEVVAVVTEEAVAAPHSDLVTLRTQ